MKTLAIYSNKGGVGKTTTAVNLSYTLARSGTRTLLVDLDSQGAATYYFPVRPNKTYNKKRLLKGSVDNFIRATDFDNLDLLPSHRSFRNLDLALGRSATEKKRVILKKILGGLQDEYELIVLDCPPNMTLLSENIVLASDVVVVPVIPTTLSVLALQQVIKMVKKLHGPRKKLAPFFSMVEQKKKLHLETMNMYRKDSAFLKTAIPYRSLIERMGVSRCPVGVSSPQSEVQLSYRKLGLEALARSKKL